MTCKHRGRRAVEDLFRAEGVAFRLIRAHKHAIYELVTPFGPRRLVCSISPSDHRVLAKQRAQIRNLLATGETRG